MTRVESPEVESVLAELGLAPRRIELVSPLGRAKGMRIAYRVETDEGQNVKLRDFGSEAAASRHRELRARLEPAFAPVVAQWGAFVVEEWIEGSPLLDAEADARAGEAAALLGRLHATSLPAGAPEEIATREWAAAAESDLDLLLRECALAAADAARIRDELSSRDPGSARAALVHLDFCAENMLIDTRGDLRVVDNELVAVRPAGLDLGRTFDRWPMPEERWARFVRGYTSAVGEAPPPTGFWRIVAALTGARVFLQRSPERLPSSLAMLRRFAAGESLADPAS